MKYCRMFRRHSLSHCHRDSLIPCLLLWITLQALLPGVGWSQNEDPNGNVRLGASDDRVAKARDLSDAFKQASKSVLPAVVTILGNSKEVNETFESLGLIPDSERFDIAGSGVILNAKGLVVTNHHVVSEAKRITVRMDDGREFKGEQVRSDKDSDLAILHIDCPEPLAFAKMGDSDQLSVGDWVLSIGSPFNFEQTVSAGIVSGKSRVLQGAPLLGQLLQTDAEINPGNSGGALVNLDGELIGINTAIVTRSGVFQGVGFAIPTARVKWITSELAERGKVRRAIIGLRADPLPKDLADEFKLPIRGGVFVSRVTPGLPADKAGILTGDIVLEVAGQKIRTKSDFAEVVEQLPIGQSHMIKLLREGKPEQVEVVPIEKKEETKQ